MHTQQKHAGYLAPKLLILLSLACFSINHTEIATAQETVNQEQTSSETVIRQATPPSQSQQQQTRARFSEEEAGINKFGGNFLDSALDGAQNFFPDADKVPGAESVFNPAQTGSVDPAKVSNFNSDISPSMGLTTDR